jgi:putative ABC transport system permease protein
MYAALPALMRTVSLRHLREAPGQTLRAIAAVMIAVGAVVTVHVFQRALLASFDRSIDAAAGRTQLEVTAGETGIPEETLETVRAVPGIEAAVPRVESAAYHVGTSGDVLTVLGVDITEEGRVRTYTMRPGADEVVDDPLVFLSRPDSIILTTPYAERHGLTRDSRFELVTSTGKHTFVVRGLLTPEGPAVGFGGNLAVMDYQAAQVVFAKRGRLDAIDVVVAAGTDVDAVAAALRARLDPGLQVEHPRQRAADLALATRAFRLLLGFFASLTLVVCMFLLYNSVSMAVAQRGREIALMRALGVRQGEAVRLFLLEALVLGVVGAALGLPFGTLVGRFMTGPLLNSLSTQFFMRVAPAQVVAVDGWVAVVGVATGIAITLFAAWFPAHQAARFAPAVAARTGAVIALRQERMLPASYGVLLLALGGAMIAAAQYYRIGVIGPLIDLTFIGGAVLLTPAVISGLTPALVRVLARLGIVGRIAALNVAANPQRSTLTAAPLMIAVALVVTLGAVVQSFRASIMDWVTTMSPHDFQIASVSLDPSHGLLMPAELAQGVATVPGVSGVYRYRMVHTTYAGRRIVVSGSDLDESQPEKTWFRFRRGGKPETLRRLARGEVVLISESFAAHFGIDMGDTLEVPTARGPLRLPVAGVVTDYNSDQGTIALGWDLFSARFGDTRYNYLMARVARDADPEAVRARIAAAYGEQHQLVIFSAADLRKEFIEIIDRAFLPVYPLFVFSVIIGCLGIANSLYVAMSERVREIGVLRSIGSRRRDVARLVIAEAGVLGLVGAVLGVGLGLLLSYVWVTVHVRSVLGWTIDFHPAGAAALLAAGAAAATAPLAGWLPARSAARIEPVAAIAHE